MGNWALGTGLWQEMKNGESGSRALGSEQELHIEISVMQSNKSESRFSFFWPAPRAQCPGPRCGATL